MPEFTAIDHEGASTSASHTPAGIGLHHDDLDWDIEAATMGVVVERLRHASPQPRLVVTINAATMWMASLDAALGAVIAAADLRVADGMGVMWAWRVLGRPLPERVAGIDLMVELVRAAAEDGRSVYLLGAQTDVVDRLAEVLVEQFPALSIAGHRDGYFGEADHAEVVRTIAQSGADVLFIGMPSPFKEVWAAEYLDEFGADLVLGVGGSFDVLAGFVPRAPELMQRFGLEWAWRLICEPRRMWKRYARTNAWLVRALATAMFRRLRGGRNIADR